MTRLTNEEFDELHRITGELLILTLKSYKASGEVPPPALLAQAIKLLGENQINRPAFTGRKVKTTDRPPPSWDEDDTTVIPFQKGS